MASLFDKLESEAFRKGLQARTKEASDWFEKNVAKLGPQNKSILKDEALTTKNKPFIGDMIMYTYDPKLKQTLPYYDRFPLTIMVDGAPGGFYGLNLHYLNYNTRAAFLDNLMEFGPAQPKESSRLTKLRYNLINSVRKYKEFKPCFKHYLGKHVVSQFSRVPMTDWEIAIFLPVEQFKKKSKGSVWNESLKIARQP